jgi:NAD(P)-dependent dehydrogenase (short-subunit alcohol dehydrogenase family)
MEAGSVIARSMANALITGSSSGFGFATAITLARRGHTVLATMRGRDGKNRAAADELLRLAESERVALQVLDLDVSSDASVDAAVAKAGPVDVLVNNAGYMVAGIAETVTPQQLLDVLGTNVVGMQRMNRAVLPGMRGRGRGLLVHVSSALGRTVMPFLGLYAATKWAVEAVAETYRYELKPSGIDVTIVEPGAFPTGQFPNRQTGADAGRAAGYGPLAGGVDLLSKGMEQMFSMPGAPHPQEVADAIAGLVDTPVGRRPARVVIDRFGGEDVDRLNEGHAQAQKKVLAAIGMAFLAE